MNWIRQFQLFLFDFDGLLVNTERLHFQAYLDALMLRGYRLKWSFADFCRCAHQTDTGLKEFLCSLFPSLEGDWVVFYAEKRKAYLELVAAGEIELMDGAKELLRELVIRGSRRCVVTHSPLEQIQAIRSQLPILETIPHWLTREDYERPKPHPDGYLRAIELFGEKGDRIIGFEDTPRGLNALRQTSALSVLIAPNCLPAVDEESQNVFHFTSLRAISEKALQEAWA